MDFLIRLLGAFVLTYFTRRLIFLVLPDSIAHRGRAIIANGLSLIAWALIAGATKTFVTSFNVHAAGIYILPQALWLALDLWSAKRRRR